MIGEGGNQSIAREFELYQKNLLGDRQLNKLIGIPPSNLLPKPARDLLIAASHVDPDAQPGESPAREKAVNKAIAKAKRDYPGYFQ